MQASVEINVKIEQAFKVGLIFGAAALAGGGGAIAISSVSDSNPVSDVATEPLAVFGNKVLQVDSERPSIFGPAVQEYLKDATVFRALAADDRTAYVALQPTGDICIVSVSDEGSTAMTCGSAGMAAAGEIVLREQVGQSTPSYFVGIAPNEITDVAVDENSGSVENNAFIAIGAPNTWTVSMSGKSGQQAEVDLREGLAPVSTQVAAD